MDMLSAQIPVLDYLYQPVSDIVSYGYDIVYYPTGDTVPSDSEIAQQLASDSVHPTVR